MPLPHAHRSTFAPAVAGLLSALALLGGCASTDVPAPAHTGLAYVKDGGPRQQGDLYLPEGSGPFPAAVVLHGGGWIGRDRSDMADVSRQLAAAGIAAFNINYRLAPEDHYPAQLEDVHAALRYLEAEATTWDLDPDRFLTVGYSAGGHLALLAAGIPDPGGPTIQAVVAGGAPVDFMLYPRSPFITKLIGGPPSEYPELWNEASPIHHVTPNHPPVFLYHARWDLIVQHKNARMMQASLEDAGISVELDTHYAKGHLLLGARQGSSIRNALEFLERFGLGEKTK